MKTSNYYRYLLLLLLLSLTGAKTYAYDIAVNNAYGVTIYYNYINDGTELEVTSGTYIGVVNIPNEVTYMNRTRAVTAIGDDAFSNRTSVTLVTIPNSVTRIGAGAFYGCNRLPSFVIPNSVTSIENSAFSNCTGLNFVNIGNSVISIGNSAFSNCTGLTSVMLPNSVISIGDRVFYGCTGLTSVTFSNSLASIGESAFYGCSGLTSVNIPTSLSIVKRDAFYNCTGLEKVIVNDIALWCEIKFYNGVSNPLYWAHHIYSDENTEITDLIIPNSVTRIGDCAFDGCSYLTSVTIPSSVITIGELAFGGCTGLTSITIPNSVTTISRSTFSGCKWLASVTIPNSVTSIGNNAFWNCTRLKKVIVNDIAAWCDIAFEGKSSNPLYYAHRLYNDENTEITSLTIPNSVTCIGDYAFSGYSGLSSVTIPSSVTSIGNYTFSDCSGLPSVTIPNTMTSIGEGAFSGCSGLTSVISKMVIPCNITSNCFPQDVFYNVTLNVPYGTTDIYKLTNYWNKFLFIEEEVSDISQLIKIQKNILIQDGFISVTGVGDGQQVAIYQTDGKQVATAKAQNGTACVATNISKGNTVIVKIGDKAIKVVMR